MLPKRLLQQSQQLTVELQSQQKELQQINEELAQKARQLADQNSEVERKKTRNEQARRALEEKPVELRTISNRTEFSANSQRDHDAAHPGRSLARYCLRWQFVPSQLTKNIHRPHPSSPNLITDILDLSKIESGTVTVEAEEMFVAVRPVERNFRHVADAKNLPFQVDFDANLPRSIVTDPKRLQQILKNLLSNAFKFTAQGHVEVKVQMVTEGWTSGHRVLSNAPKVVSFAISDTGIGIAPEKQRLIFEAFQQADVVHRAANTAALVWAWRFPANWQRCSAVKSA